MYNPLSLVRKDEVIATGSFASDKTFQEWKILDEGPYAGARVLVAVTVSPPDEQGNIDPNPDRFKSLTSTPAFFLYVGSATFVLIVCVCCMWGKGSPPPARPMPARLQELNSKSSVMFTERPVAREPEPAVTQQASAQDTYTRPTLTVEVSTPLAGRRMAVVAVDGTKAEEGRANEPPPNPPPAQWSWPWLALLKPQPIPEVSPAQRP
jgi:hypothetical protein